MGVDIELYNQDYGQRIQLNTWCDEVQESTGQAMRMKRESTGETYSINAALVPLADLDKEAKNAIVATIAPNFLKDKLGLWNVAAQITWIDATISGKPLWLRVKRHPTITTTTTSTTSTTTTTTAP